MSKKKNTYKVAHLSTVHPPFDVRIFHKECRSIARAGYDVTLIASHDHDEVRDGVRICALPRSRNRMSRMTWGTWGIYRKAMQQDADLYHFHDPELIPIGVIMRLRGKKVVYDVHEDISADLALKHYIPRHLRRSIARLASMIEAAAANLFSGIVPATPWIAGRFNSLGENVVTVSNYPLTEEAPVANTRLWGQRSSAVAYAGFLARDRCIGEMVNAMAFVSQSLGVTLKLAGAFKPKSLESEIGRMDGWSRAEFLGTLTPSEVAFLLEDVRAGLLLYRPDPNNLQAVPNKLFEYMRAGLPVIASDFPSFREIIDEVKCGVLVDPLDPKAIASAVEYIFNNSKEAEEMGLRGKQAVLNRFNWPSQERKLLHLYTRLLESPHTD